MLPLTDPFASIVQESQTPWERLKRTFKTLHVPQRIGQIVHLADTVTLLLNDKESALNQVDHVKECIHNIGEREFGPEVLAGFDKLCGIEAVWLDVVYRPEIFLDLITIDQSFSLDETVRLTEFMSKIVDFRSPFTAMHSAGVAATAVALAELSNMSEDECGMMRIAGYLHDIGKLKIPNVILDKPGKLTDHEFNIMKEHAYYSWILLKDIRGFETISKWAALHHEKLNGKGYPFHMMKEELTLGSRIMTVADIFSALTENRPYRRSMDKEKVIGILRGDAGSGLISGGVVELLIDHYDAINARRDAESRAASKKYQQSLEKAREA
jgi:HD-GYP domain-containing protein (c-di-GMP phosphodiesterase class II)